MTCLPPDPDTIADAISGFSGSVLAWLPPDRDIAMIEHDPWSDGWHVVWGCFASRLEDVPRRMRQHDADPWSHRIWIFEDDDDAVAIRRNARSHRRVAIDHRDG